MFAVCQKYHASRTIPLFNTVCKEAKDRSYEITLVGGFDNTTDDIPILKLVDDDTYISAIDKNLKAIQYHYKLNTSFDFYMICDDDTFINFDNLDKLINKISDTKLALYGSVGPICNDGRSHVTGGPGILMNRRTFNVLAETINKFYLKHQLYSDVTIALNAHKYNESCERGQDTIDFYNIEEFLHPHKHLIDIKDVSTYHISGRNSYYDLYNKLKPCNQN